MPVVALAPGAIAPAPPAPVEPITIGPTTPAHTPRVITWEAPNGDTLVLTAFASAYGQDWGRTGFEAPPMDVKWDELPVGGAAIRQMRAQPKTLAWPQHVFASDQADLDEKWTRLVRAFDHDVASEWTTGRLTVTSYDGRSRYVDAYYLEGLEGDDSRGAFAPGQLISTPIRVVALDPYWQSADEIVHTVLAGYTPHSFYATGRGFYPLRVVPSQVLGALTVMNPGDQEAWPILELVGPGSGVIVRSNTLGKQFTLTRNLVAGETVTSDAYAKTVTGPDGSWKRYMSFPGSTQWPLVRGENKIAVTMTGTTSASRVRIRFRPRWRNP